MTNRALARRLPVALLSAAVLIALLIGWTAGAAPAKQAGAEAVQAAPGGWGNWASLGNCQYGCHSPAASSWGFTRLDVFALSRDFELIQTTRADGLWSGWKPVDGSPKLRMRSLAAVSWGPGRIDVFGVGDTATYGGPLWQVTYADGAWSDWKNLGGEWNGNIAVSSWGPNRLDVFASEKLNPEDPQLTKSWHRTYTTAGWSDWTVLADRGFVQGAVSTKPGQIDIVAVDNQVVQHRRFADNAWSSWTPLGGPELTGPVITGSGDRLDIFLQGRDENLYRRTYNGFSWGTWQPVPGAPHRAIADPAVVSWGDRIELFGHANREANVGIVHKTY
ncbi:hypothetical protein GCM10029976_021940 [Kribbella albertanoniae]|uniref:PLL-like beta propeller domain-containing protein n=1 Tax=Kribbella albertanoniae TaxID=1266829 RepID=A0A4R4Q3Y8_9ACTN|nr:hypothetical protein [Kribbella albertanoniae]TDC29523.1 hypothetical protein E1261_15580 [Kribbella albertanoniae]